MKRVTAALLCLILVCSLVGCGETQPQPGPDPLRDTIDYLDGPTEPTPPAPPAMDGTRVSPVGDYAVLTALFREKRNAWHMDFAAVNEEASDGLVKPAATAAPTENADADFSGTNVQVAGIDEGDIVKTDGKYLYILREHQELVIVEAAGADSAVLSRTGLRQREEQSGEKENSHMSRIPEELLLSGRTLAVLSRYSSWHSYENAAGDYRYESEDRMEVDFYDVSDPTAPVKTASLGQDGDILSSRLFGGCLYLVTRWYAWDWDEARPETYIPRLYCDGAGTLAPADCIYIAPEDVGSQYLTVAAYDLERGTCLGSQSLLGAGDTVYMSRNRLYVAGSHQHTDESAPRSESVYTVKDYVNYSETAIHSFTLDGGAPALAASGSVPGLLESQFSMDEYDGHLRLVTTVRRSSYTVYEDAQRGFINYVWDEEGSPETNALYILDAGLNIVGSVENLAPGEQVYSARFDGDTAYFCTFRQTDPLFAVDVSEPTAPKVLSALKISGFSEYLHSWGEGLLFGLGREADEDSGWAEEMKLVMFDTGDKGNVTAAHTLRCDCDYSEALYDHKAVFIAPERNIIGFQGDDRYYIYGYAPETGFFLQACLDTGDAWAARGLYIGDCAYIVGERTLLVADCVDGWTELLRLDLTA